MNENHLLIISVIGNVVMCGMIIYVMIADQNKIEKLQKRVEELENPGDKNNAKNSSRTIGRT